MSSQEPLKKKSKQDNGLFCLYSECTCVDVMYFVPVCTSAYHMDKHAYHMDKHAYHMDKHKTYNGSEH